MTIHEATEAAYKNGYEQGKKDAVGDKMSATDATKWIPVTERLPEDMDWVLCASVFGDVHILRYDYIMDDWDIFGKPNTCYAKGFVTHWMPFPEAPKEDA